MTAPWFVFDLDDTLLINDTKQVPGDITIISYDDTERVLRYLHDRNYPIALASFRTNADEVLQQFGLRHYFDDLEYGQDERTKVDMINNLAQRLGLNPVDAIFFDDNYQNVIEATNNLIHTIAIDPAVGTTLEILFDALQWNRARPVVITGWQRADEAAINQAFPLFRKFFINHYEDAQTITNKLHAYNPIILQLSPGRVDLFIDNSHYYTLGDDLGQSLAAILAQPGL